MTPELYTGQAEVVAGKLRELELFQAADEAEAETTDDPKRKAALLRTMAGRVSTITTQRNFLAKLTEERDESLRIRLSAREKATLQQLAADTGESVSAYVRRTCGL